MKFRTLLLSTALGLTALTAQAGELYTPAQYEDPVTASAPTLTGAQSKQAIALARARGDYNHNDMDLPKTTSTPFGRSRADVKAEVLAARRTGGLEHDDVDVPAVAKGSVLTRQEVRQDVLAARQATRNAPVRNTIDY